MGGFDGGNDTLGPCQILKSVHSFVVGDGYIFSPADVMQMGMFGADTGVVKTCGDGVNRRDLTVGVLTEVTLHTVEDAHAAGGNGGGGLKGVDAPSGGFAADETDILILNEMVERADSVGATAHAGDHRVGELAFFLQHLLFDLLGDHRLKITDHGGEGVGTHDGADAVVGVMDPAGPFDHGLIHRVLQSSGAAGDGDDLRTQQTHPVHVQRLPDGVLFAHEHHTFHIHQCRCGGGCHTVLTGTGLGNEAGLAHLLGKERLTQHIVDLVGAGVV